MVWFAREARDKKTNKKQKGAVAHLSLTLMAAL
jgi:hypothetical protein